MTNIKKLACFYSLLTTFQALETIGNIIEEHKGWTCFNFERYNLEKK